MADREETDAVVVAIVLVVVVIGAVVVVVLVAVALPYRSNSSIEDQLVVLAAVSTTITYCAVWVGKLTISGLAAPAQVATVAQEVLLAETSTS